MDLTDFLNQVFKGIPSLPSNYRFLIYLGSLILVAFITGLITTFILHKIVKFYNRRKKLTSLTFLMKYMQRPMKFFLPMLLLLIWLPMLDNFRHYYGTTEKIISVLFYSSFTWILVNLVYTLFDTMIAHHDITLKDNLKERRIITQLQFVRRLLVIVVVIISVSLILLNFDNVRKLGAGILTSAGVLGIIIGFAAQRSISNLLAGLQVAFTQPIRIDDVVVVENEFGNIEEINLTYVVVRIWDQRRLVLPLNYFIEKPFQNWTKTSSDILGTVFFYVDYKMPVDEMKEELMRLLKDQPLWDKKVAGLQVTNTTDKTMEVRALVSSADSGKSWDLRCFIRERMIAFIREKYPDYLPVMRAEVDIKQS